MKHESCCPLGVTIQQAMCHTGTEGTALAQPVVIIRLNSAVGVREGAVSFPVDSHYAICRMFVGFGTSLCLVIADRRGSSVSLQLERILLQNEMEFTYVNIGKRFS